MRVSVLSSANHADRTVLRPGCASGQVAAPRTPRLGARGGGSLGGLRYSPLLLRSGSLGSSSASGVGIRVTEGQGRGTR